MGEIVDRVAKAMALRCNRVHDWPFWQDEARAAIESLREPSDKMVKAAIDRDNPGDHEYANYIACSHEEAWRSMIEAALE